jgi:hypothetical protein
MRSLFVCGYLWLQIIGHFRIQLHSSTFVGAFGDELTVRTWHHAVSLDVFDVRANFHQLSGADCGIMRSPQRASGRSFRPGSRDLRKYSVCAIGTCLFVGVRVNSTGSRPCTTERYIVGSMCGSPHMQHFSKFLQESTGKGSAGRRTLGIKVSISSQSLTGLHMLILESIRPTRNFWVTALVYDIATKYAQSEFRCW